MEYTLVGANLIERDGNVLLVQEGKSEVRGLWNLPSGRVEPTEDPIECARREASEETGLDVRPESLVGIYADRSAVAPGSEVLVFVFESIVIDGDPSSENDSVIDWMWAGSERRSGLSLREGYVPVAISDYFGGARAPLSLLQDLREEE